MCQSMKKLRQCVIEHFLSIFFPPLFSTFGNKNVDDDFMKKSIRKEKEKLTNGHKCTSPAGLRMHLMIEKK